MSPGRVLNYAFTASPGLWDVMALWEDRLEKPDLAGRTDTMLTSLNATSLRAFHAQHHPPGTLMVPVGLGQDGESMQIMLLLWTRAGSYIGHAI